MQNAKDSFYQLLRDRLADLNPERTVVVRGITRPGLLVDENETESVSGLPDCFHLRWTEAAVTEDGLLPLVAVTCELNYATAGTAMNGGLDRGRCLGAMDGELLAAVRQYPQNVAKQDYSALASGGSAAAMNTRVWWSAPSFGPVKVKADQLTRATTLQVLSYQEEGEL
jgi:hypothetical protein